MQTSLLPVNGEAGESGNSPTTILRAGKVPPTLRALLSVSGAAEHLGVSIPTVRRLLRDGALPHHRIGDRVVFTDEDLSAFLASVAVPATREPTLRERQAAASAARRTLRASHGGGDE